ncbi:MAG: signal peptide peptidase SppA [Armatimonadota bacterium]|nr:signal peptide peptidase SppA [Armatimonadota bacterium]MDR7548843.1 signal peptide peptidase SppA [Armatimonadota bacterium]
MKQSVAVTLGVVLAAVALAAAACAGGLVGFAAGAATGTAASWSAGPPERHISGQGRDKIVVVRVIGPLTREEGVGPFFGGASSRRIVQLLDRAQQDAEARAVILELDTPGGSIVASDEIHRKVTAVRRAGKPVVALMTETAASGGYYIAAGADAIVADPTTVTGSIGVIVALPNIEELIRKIGIRTVVFKSGAFKDLGNPTRRMTPAEAAIFQSLVDEAYERFVGIVAQGRRMDPARVRRLADGRVYTGRQAHRLGLVDILGHLPEAVAEALRRAGLREARVVEYGTEGVLKGLLGWTGHRLRVWLPGPADIVPGPGAPFRLQYLMVP